MRRATFILLLSGSVLGGCRHESPKFMYMPDMVWQPALKAQSPGANRPPPEGVAARGHDAYPYPAGEAGLAEAGRELRNPLPGSRAVLQRGQQVYNTYCIVCHGEYGEGNGYIVPKFPAPPSLQSDKVRAFADGSIFHIITTGQNRMGSYASQIQDRDDRWAAIHYIRVLQRAKKPTPQDIEALKAWQSAGK